VSFCCVSGILKVFIENEKPVAFCVKEVNVNVAYLVPKMASSFRMEGRRELEEIRI
jgi:hypothetical protein